MKTPLETLPVKPDWIISDQHYFHPNIIKYSGRPEDHNEQMTKNWLELVEEDDVVLNLGDVALPGGIEQFAQEIMPQLKCKTHYLMLGNHDKGKRKMGKHELKKFYTDMGFHVIRPFSMVHHNTVYSFTHAPGNEFRYGDEIDRTALVKEDDWVNVHGHIHTHLVKHPRMVNVSVEQTDYKPVHFLTLAHAVEERMAAGSVEPLVMKDYSPVD